MRTKKEKSMIISCGVQGCCPVVEIKGEDVSITDDFGGVVKMNKTQWIGLVDQSLKKNIIRKN